MTDVTNDLDILFPDGYPVMVNGEELRVQPFPFRRFPKVSKLLVPIMQALVQQDISAFNPQMLESSSTNERLATVGDLMCKLFTLAGDEGENFLELLALAIKKDVDWFDNVSMDEGVSIAIAVFHANKDMIVKKIFPMVQALSVTSAGVLSSANSSQTAID